MEVFCDQTELSNPEIQLSNQFKDFFLRNLDQKIHLFHSFSQEVENGAGPNVEAALSTSPTAAASSLASRKPTIGQRKAPAKKGGVSLHKVCICCIIIGILFSSFHIRVADKTHSKCKPDALLARNSLQQISITCCSNHDD